MQDEAGEMTRENDQALLHFICKDILDLSSTLCINSASSFPMIPFKQFYILINNSLKYMLNSNINFR